MRGKMAFLTGLAVGFVLGTREGRERYDQMVQKARQLLDHPTVQEAKGVVQAQATRLYEEGRDVVTEKLGNTKVGERLRSHGNGTSTTEDRIEAITPGRTTGPLS
jgi:hypothetical protein